MSFSCWPPTKWSNFTLSEGIVSDSEPKKPFLRTATLVRVLPSTVTSAEKNVYSNRSRQGWLPQVGERISPACA